MYFFLHDSFATRLAFSAEEILQLDTLLASVSHGYHVVHGSRATFDRLQRERIGSRSDAVVRRIANTYATTSGRFSKLVPRIVVKLGKGSVVKKGTQFEVPLGILTSIEISGPKFLGENQTDTKFLYFAAVHYGVRTGVFSSFLLSYDPRGCGGSQLPVEIEAALGRNQMVLSFSDSDKVDPKAGSSPTTKKCQEIRSKHLFMFEHIELPARDVENLIPVEVVTLLCDIDAKAGIDRVVSNPAIWRIVEKYVDMKEGVTAYDIGTSNVYKAQSAQTFWNTALKKVLEPAQYAQSCLGNGCHCPSAPKVQCRCIFFPALGSNLLSRVTVALENDQNRTIYSKFASREEWIVLGNKFFDWFVADEPIRV